MRSMSASVRSIRCSAPARANLIGNPSDQYGGVTVSCTVPLHAQVTLEASEGWVLQTGGREQQVGAASDLEPRDDVFDLARAVLRHVGLDAAPARLRFESGIPRQSGLAGSTALLVAMLAGLLDWRGAPLAGAALAERAREVERGELGVTCGYVDHYLCVLGGLRRVDFAGKTPEGAAPPEPFATTEEISAELPFLLAYTGVRHSSDAVHRPIRERWLAGEQTVRAAYERVASLGRTGSDALRAADWSRLGAVMNENHDIQRGLGGSGVSDDRLIDAARSAGALGAKLAGAGGGGTIVALWPDPETRPLRDALRSAGATAFYVPVPGPGVQIERA